MRAQVSVSDAIPRLAAAYPSLNTRPAGPLRPSIRLDQRLVGDVQRLELDTARHTPTAERPPAQHFNWWQNLVGLWARWLDEREQDVARRIVQIAAADRVDCALQRIHCAFGVLQQIRDPRLKIGSRVAFPRN